MRRARWWKRRVRFGQVVVLGDSNFTHRSWKVAPFFSIAGGGATFQDLRNDLFGVPNRNVRAIIIALGINCRPHSHSVADCIAELQRAVQELRAIHPHTPILHLEVPTFKSAAPHYHADLNRRIRLVLPQMSHPTEGSTNLHYSNAERTSLQHYMLQWLESRGW